MAVRAITKKDPEREVSVECSVIGVRSAFKPRHARFVFPPTSIWTVDGPLGSAPLTPRVLDLLDLVGAIYRIESQVPQRLTNPMKEWRITAPVRDPRFWAAEGGTLLGSSLGFLNRALWTFTFERRRNSADPILTRSNARKVEEVILFSGGMDSACGAGVHKSAKQKVQLASFSTRQGGLQRAIATELGHLPPTQWRLHGGRGKEGMNLIRSIVFLTLGAVVAETFGASTIFQYENGVLAAAIPPSGSFIPTRHAHPELHRRMERLFKVVFEREIVIRNPFALLTKRETAQQFSKSVGSSLSESILRRTETCWRLAQAQVGGKPKRPGTPCGVCTPCIIRRTARPFEASKEAWQGWRGYAYDLKKPRVHNHAKLGLTFRAYLELINIVLDFPDDRGLIEELAPEARALIDGPAGPRSEDIAPLLRRFAKEFCDTFEIARPVGRS